MVINGDFLDPRFIDYFDGRLFHIICVDPPWKYGNRHAVRHDTAEPTCGIGPTYPLISLERMKVVPVHKLAAKECLLFLWATGPHIMNAGELGEAWGFEYVTKGFCWIKANAGMWRVLQDTLKQTGFVAKAGKHRNLETLIEKLTFFGNGTYTAHNSEDVFIFKRGKNTIHHAKKERQIVVTPLEKKNKRGEKTHSKKPSAVQNRIDTMYPFELYDRVELFARKPRHRWVSFGNELARYADVDYLK